MARQPDHWERAPQPSPHHHYRRNRPGIDQEADQELEELVRWLVKERGLTREEALKHARHWV